jgi:hypothetical protein
MEDDAAKVGPPAPDVTQTEIDGRISVYDPRTEQVTMLNETASDVWRLSDGTQSVEEIVGALARAYAVDASAIREQVTDAVKQFYDAGLLTLTPTP